MILKKKSLVIVMAALCAALATAGCGKVNLGYVDYTRVQQEAPQVKDSIAELQSKTAEMEKEGNQKLQEAAQNNASQEDMQKLQQQYKMKAAGLQQQYSNQIKMKIDAAMGSIAKEKNLDTVVQKNGIVVEGGTDVTDDLIAKLQ